MGPNFRGRAPVVRASVQYAANLKAAKAAAAAKATEDAIATSTPVAPGNTKGSAQGNTTTSAARGGAKRNRPAKLVSTETKFLRSRYSSADITISKEGVWFNQYKIVKSTFSNTYVKNEVSHPFQAADYDFIENFTKGFSRDQRVSFLSKNWIEIVIHAENTADDTAIILDHLAKLGDDFSDHIKNLVLKFELPPLSETVKLTEDIIFSSEGFRGMLNIVREVNTYPSITTMNVVLSLPHDFPEPMHDLQLIYALAFWPLNFTKWTFKFLVPGMHHPKLAPKEDFKRLNKLDKILAKPGSTNGLEDWVR
jgi:hypothetical protein